MSATIQQVKSPKNPPETIIDKSPKTPFKSPLQKYIENFCEHCDFYKVKCRFDDTIGVQRMHLCLELYPYETPKRNAILKVER